jgi:pimeloyl-ACP methyl ester carboxylesterase
VILLANRGVGASTGVVPDNVSDMARDVIRFVDALPLGEIDLLGFSLGGYIGQELASSAPGLIRNLCSPARRRKALRRSTAGRTMSTRLLPKTYPTGGRIELAHPCVRSAAYRDARRGLPPHPSRTRRRT